MSGGQVRVSRSKASQRRGSQDEPQAEPQRTEEAQARADALKAELDELLEDIDAVLEANGEELVRDYVQRGGQ